MIEVKLDEYQGPLDLLLELIKKNKIDIYDIPINEITSEYLDILKNSARENIEIKVEFLYLASTLLRIKTRMLLPSDNENDEDPREDLVEQLIMYNKFKIQSKLLMARYHYNMKSFSRLPDRERFNIGVSYKITGSKVSLKNHFIKLTEKFMETEEEREADVIVKDKYKINDFTVKILDILKEVRVSSLKTLSDNRDKEFVITAFMAILELLNSGVINFKQEHIFDDIVLEIK